jgi:hypothetical protein
MTLRPDLCVLRGVIRNDVPNTTDGWLQTGPPAKPQPPLLLSLVGNLPGQLAGQSLLFSPPAATHNNRPQPTPTTRLHRQQIGVVSHCTFHTTPRNSCSFAWHGPNGLVHLHSHNCRLLADPADTESPALAELQLDCLLEPDPDCQPAPFPRWPLPTATQLPDPDRMVSEQQAWLILQPLLARMARAAVSFHMCPHCSCRTALKQLIHDVLPQLQHNPQPHHQLHLRSFTSAENCPLCQQEFQDWLPPAPVSKPEKPRNPQKQPFPVSGSGSRIWNSGTGSTSMVGW